MLNGKTKCDFCVISGINLAGSVKCPFRVSEERRCAQAIRNMIKAFRLDKGGKVDTE